MGGDEVDAGAENGACGNRALGGGWGERDRQIPRFIPEDEDAWPAAYTGALGGGGGVKPHAAGGLPVVCGSGGWRNSAEGTPLEGKKPRLVEFCHMNL